MPEEIHETIIIELYSLLSLLLCEAGDRSRLVYEPSAREGSKNGASLLSKLALSAGSTAGAQKCGSMRACGGGDAYHYSPVVQTYSGMGCKPILVHESTNSGRW